MYIAMNRFKIKLGCEQEFIDLWRNRDSYLNEVPGFKSFNLLQGKTFDDYTLFSSHAVWESKDAFRAWVKSDAFKKAHADAMVNRDVYAGSTNLECFEAVL
ncbi:MAG: antibiotic biosynthesis monooxygenase [Pseudomonadota bacterium]